MEELWVLSKAAQANQLLYNLSRRGIEWDLLPWLRERRVPVMAYSPIEQARLLKNRALLEFSKRHGMTPAQAALAWLLANDDVIVIPKASNPAHLQENLEAIEKNLTREQLAELDRAFPPPRAPSPLEML
jgi:diketogulonate reductase-like aldo/keto reductase